ncbi:hypothetical protein KX928_23385 [Roseobacter sp. YSTF-M11]|uniref:Uncharacterized protein n=1 Tax=Roseobacter insulae TaxID=2859783 RepID=A0A9X1K2Y1_9RHOB|nr:hypothetical protein [Roseobacter insulae]MBW4710744.1 hypothetical protein [Roseobacter insulae]
MFDKIASLFGEHPWVSTAVAGAAGGVVRWVTLRDNWKEGGAAVIVGAICAVYLEDLAITLLGNFLSIEIPPSSKGLSGFIIGLAGITLTGFIIDVFKARAKYHEEEDKKDG